MTDSPATSSFDEAAPDTSVISEGGGAVSEGGGAERREAAIRRAGPDDAALLHDVAAATFALACPPGTTAEAIADFIARHLSAERFAEYLSDPERVLFVAIDGETAADGPNAADGPTEVVGQTVGETATAVGYTMVVFGEPTDADVVASITVRPTAELSKVYVRAERHGGGVAGRLVEASVDAARARGARGVWLGVNQENAKANRFYEKQGFALVGTKKFLVGEKYEDDFVRELAL